MAACGILILSSARAVHHNCDVNRDRPFTNIQLSAPSFPCFLDNRSSHFHLAVLCTVSKVPLKVALLHNGLRAVGVVRSVSSKLRLQTVYRSHSSDL